MAEARPVDAQAAICVHEKGREKERKGWCERACTMRRVLEEMCCLMTACLLVRITWPAAFERHARADGMRAVAATPPILTHALERA